MDLLVDYDNIEQVDRQRGLGVLIEKILRTLGAQRLQVHPKVNFRLYGGWYLKDRPSRTAQRLIPDIQANFPKRTTIVDMINGSHHTVTSYLELAQSLKCAPAHVLHSTFRERSYPVSIKAYQTPFSGCINRGSCPVASIDPFISSMRCTEPHCGVTPNDVLYRAEQKLVDGMMIADAIYLATSKRQELCIVSSDDDLWPAIHSAIASGAKVYHIQTKPRHVAPTQYVPNDTSRYEQMNL